MRGLLGPLLKLIAFIVVTVLATGILGLTIANTGASGGDSFKAMISDVTGLNKGDDVRVSGVRIGSVTGIKLINGPGAKDAVAEVSMGMEKGRTLPEGSTVTVKFRNLVGQRYIAMGRSDPNATKPMPDGAVIPLDRTAPALNLTALFGGFKPLFQALDPGQINQLSYEIIQVFQGEGATVSSLVSSTASLTNSIADKDKVIGELLVNLNSVLDTVNQRADKVSSLVISLQQLVSGLAQDRGAITSSISSLADLTDATANLLKPAREPLKTSLAGLGDLSANLNTNNEELNKFLFNLPRKLDSITRLASYGSWFNFYLCSAGATVGTGGFVPPFELPNGIPTLQLSVYTNSAPRCSAGGGN
ncbi:MAG: MlaD family protein [Mycobacteriaceae bacterium]